MPSYLQTIKEQGDQLFGKRGSLLSLWQDIAENFYPERADFTTCRNIGEEIARNLMTSYPLIVRRDLGNAFGSMLRPSSKDWFAIGTSRPDREDTEAKQWLQWASKLQRNAMMDRVAQFARATKEADNDFAAFGQAVISVELNAQGNALLYRCWHLRDVAWCENAEGAIDTVHRKWKPTAGELLRLFPKTVHQQVREKCEKNPYTEVNVRHVVVTAEQYAGMPGTKKMRTPFVGCYIDCDNDHEMECEGLWAMPYVVPRWQTVSGSQYAHSPATVAALPDARLLQDVTRVLLEAGEKATNPPMIAVKDAIRSDIAIYAGGVTWVDAEYDERLGEVLRPISQDKTGLNFGRELGMDIRSQLMDAFYLNKLNLPPVGGPDMTAYEVGQRVQEFIRNALPLFEPMEVDYNGRLCETTFEILLRNSPEMRMSVPPSIQGAEIQFRFESPLREATEKLKVGQYMESAQILANAIQMDPSVIHLVDGRKATRDVLTAVIPAAWIRTEADVAILAAQQAQQQQAQQLLAMMQQGSEVAKNLGGTQSAQGAVA